jgi:hypothetical protein
VTGEEENGTRKEAINRQRNAKVAYAKSELVFVVGLLSSQSEAHGIAAIDQKRCRHL